MVAVIGLIVFGPQRLPEIARTVGKALAELKRQASDIRSEFESGLNDPEDEKPAPLPESSAAASTQETPPSSDE